MITAIMKKVNDPEWNVNVNYFYEILCTMNNLKLVHQKCHVRKAHTECTVDLTKILTKDAVVGAKDAVVGAAKPTNRKRRRDPKHEQRPAHEYPIRSKQSTNTKLVLVSPDDSFGEEPPRKKSPRRQNQRQKNGVTNGVEKSGDEVVDTDCGNSGGYRASPKGKGKGKRSANVEKKDELN